MLQKSRVQHGRRKWWLGVKSLLNCRAPVGDRCTNILFIHIYACAYTHTHMCMYMCVCQISIRTWFHFLEFKVGLKFLLKFYNFFFINSYNLNNFLLWHFFLPKTPRALLSIPVNLGSFAGEVMEAQKCLYRVSHTIGKII